MKRASLILIPSLLLACGVAQARTPAQAPQKAPSASQQQAAALTPATPQQTASCTKVANAVIDEMDNGDFSTAAKAFSPKLGVDKGKLKSLWTNIIGKFGHVKSIGQSPKGQMIKDYTVVVVPVQFDKGQLASQVACDSDGTVVDMRFGKMPSSAQGGAPKS